MAFTATTFNLQQPDAPAVETSGFNKTAIENALKAARGLASTGFDEATIARLTSAALALPPSIRSFGAVGGDQALDTAAAQAMVDAGYTSCLIPDDGNEYEILGVVIPQGQFFEWVGESQSAIIAVRGTVATYGNLTSHTSVFSLARNVQLKVYDDCIAGIFHLKFCRNGYINNLLVTDATNGTAIGTVFKFDRSYQMNLNDLHGVIKGVSIYELGDSTGNEVLDTVSLGVNVVWHSNYTLFIKSGALNVHNLIVNSKLRDVTGSGEDDVNNVGETTLTAGYAAGVSVITVTDASLLNNGNLAADNLLYLGVGYNAEQVRVASVSGNQITLDTPLRFAKSAGHPVIFGAVFITLESVYSFVSPHIHCEGAYISIHAKNVRGLSQQSAYTTSKIMYRIIDNCRGWTIGPVTYGNRGWSSVSLFDIPAYHDGGKPCRTINLIGDLQGDSGVTFNTATNNSTQPTDDIIAWRVGADKTVDRAYNMTINTRETAKITINITAAIGNLTLTDGMVPGQRLELTFVQDATGNRFIEVDGATGNTKTNAVLHSNMVLSTGPHYTDRYEFVWDGVNWHEISRQIGDTLNPPFVGFTFADPTNEINTRNKYQGKPVRRQSDNQLLVAAGSEPTDPWLSVSGTAVVTPTEN